MDPVLLRRCLAGDSDAFADLFDQYKNLVYRTAILTLGDPADAEDVMQEVFVRVHRSLGKYDPSRGAFTTWLYRITVNQALNWRRRRSHLWSLDGLPEQKGELMGQESRHDDGVMVQEALGRLSPKLRVVVILRYYWDLSYAEIAEILEVPLGTVKSRLNAAITGLRDEIRDEPFGLVTRRPNNELP